MAHTVLIQSVSKVNRSAANKKARSTASGFCGRKTADYCSACGEPASVLNEQVTSGTAPTEVVV